MLQTQFLGPNGIPLQEASPVIFNAMQDLFPNLDASQLLHRYNVSLE